MTSYESDGPAVVGGDRVLTSVQVPARTAPRRPRHAGPLAGLLWATMVLLVLLAGGTPAAAAGEGASPATGPVTVTLFWGEGCPHCAAERAFLADLAATRPDLVVNAYEVYNDPANRELFFDMAEAAGIEPQAVPTTFVGDRVWVGFSEPIATEIQAVVDDALAALVPPTPSPVPEPPTATPEAAGPPAPADGAPIEKAAVVDVPLVGPVDVGAHSLLVSTLVIGFVDGVNPCSLWVLSILLALVLHARSRRRVVIVGTVFLVVTSAMYGLYMAGFYSALRYADYLGWIQRAVAVVVAVLGLLQLKDVVAFHRGPSLGVPERAKPGMYQRMRRLGDTDRPLPAVLGATAALAVGVSLLETPCTLGLPLLWTDLLARNDVATAGAVLLFAVYLAAFLLDELIVFAAVVATMRAVRLQERHGRELKLVSGVTMLTLAVAMFASPALLETVGGALAVFGAAALLAAGGLLTLRLRARA